MPIDADSSLCAVVVYHDAKERLPMLAETLRSIVRQKPYAPAHVVLVSNGAKVSPDDMWRRADGVSAKNTTMHPIVLETNHDVAAAKGRALSMAAREFSNVRYVATFDFNCAPREDWFVLCKEEIAKDGKTASVGGRIVDWNDAERTVCNLHSQRKGATYDEQYATRGEPKERGNLGACTCGGLYSVEWLKRVETAFGSLIEPAIGHYYDCTDLLARLHALGGACSYAPKAIAKKEKFPRDFDKLDDRRFLEIRNRLWIVREHYSDPLRSKLLAKISEETRARYGILADRAIEAVRTLPSLRHVDDRLWLNAFG